MSVLKIVFTSVLVSTIFGLNFLDCNFYLECQYFIDEVNKPLQDKYACTSDDNHGGTFYGLREYSIKTPSGGFAKLYLGKYDEKDKSWAEKMATAINSAKNSPGYITLHHAGVIQVKSLNYLVVIQDEFDQEKSLQQYLSDHSMLWTDSRAIAQIGLDLARIIQDLQASKIVTNALDPQIIFFDKHKPRLVKFHQMLNYPTSKSNPLRKIMEENLTNGKFDPDSVTDVYPLGKLMLLMAQDRNLYSTHPAEVENPGKVESIMVNHHMDRTLMKIILGCLQRNTHRSSISKVISSLEAYLASPNDNLMWIGKLSLKTGATDIDAETNFSVVKIDDKNVVKDSNGRYEWRDDMVKPIRRLTELDSESPSGGSEQLPLVWAGSAVLMFLVFWAVAAWVHRLRAANCKIDAVAGSDLQTPVEGMA